MMQLFTAEVKTSLICKKKFQFVDPLSQFLKFGRVKVNFLWNGKKPILFRFIKKVINKLL